MDNFGAHLVFAPGHVALRHGQRASAMPATRPSLSRSIDRPQCGRGEILGSWAVAGLSAALRVFTRVRSGATPAVKPAPMASPRCADYGANDI